MSMFASRPVHDYGPESFTGSAHWPWTHENGEPTLEASSTAVPATNSSSVAIANPAAVYCTTLGGSVEIAVEAGGGQVGICNLPDGSKIDEWELFRRDHPSPSDTVSTAESSSS
jgi:uncharacterized protein